MACIQDLIDFVRPTKIVNNPLKGLTWCILAPLNSQVHYYNNIIFTWLPGQQHIYLSTDHLKEMDALQFKTISSISDVYLNHTHPRMPPHKLILKANGLFKLMHNLSIDKGLVKNMCVVITSLWTYTIGIRKLTTFGGRNLLDPGIYYLPWIKYTHQDPSGHTMIRLQFPLAPAYTSTFNGCQGLTLDRIGLDLTIPVFFPWSTIYSSYSNTKSTTCYSSHSTKYYFHTKCYLSRTTYIIYVMFSIMKPSIEHGALAPCDKLVYYIISNTCYIGYCRNQRGGEVKD